MTDVHSGNSGLDTGNQGLVAEDAPMRAAGVRQKNGDDEGAVAGFWLLVPGFWWLVAGHFFNIWLQTIAQEQKFFNLRRISGHRLLKARSKQPLARGRKLANRSESPAVNCIIDSLSASPAPCGPHPVRPSFCFCPGLRFRHQRL